MDLNITEASDSDYTVTLNGEVIGTASIAGDRWSVIIDGCSSESVHLKTAIVNALTGAIKCLVDDLVFDQKLRGKSILFNS